MVRAFPAEIQSHGKLARRNEAMPAAAADGGALLAEAVFTGRQRDFAAEVRGLDRQARQLVVFGNRAVHVIDEQQVGLAGFDTRGQNLDPQRAGRHLADDRAILR